MPVRQYNCRRNLGFHRLRYDLVHSPLAAWPEDCGRVADWLAGPVTGCVLAAEWSRACSANIVRKPNRAYFMNLSPMRQRSPMLEVAASNTPRLSRPLLVTGTVVVLLVGGTTMLWAHYGTAVFYEMIVAGIAACF